MNTLNKGKFSPGSNAQISYGDQSPADDAIPLAWSKGDVRIYQEIGTSSASKNNLKWVCIAAGTPGTWQLVRTPYTLPLLQEVNVYKGAWTFGGDSEIFMAPATADWNDADEGNPNPLMVPLPTGFDLESTGPGPTLVVLSVWLSKNDWDVATANGLLFRIRLNDGTILGSGTVNANGAFTGRFDVIGVVLAAGILTGNAGLRASLEVAAAAGTGSIDLAAVMTVYRDFSADFPS